MFDSWTSAESGWSDGLRRGLRSRPRTVGQIMDDLSGGVLSLEHRYEVVERLHTGLLATTYLGVLQPFGTPINIVSFSGLFSLDVPGAALRSIGERLKAAARSATRINGQRLLRVLDYGQLAGGIPFVVTDAPEGPSLREIVDHQGRLPLSGTVDLVADLARAVSQLHAVGVGHLALRPECVWFRGAADRSDVVVGGRGLGLLRHELSVLGLDGCEPLPPVDHLAPETFNDEVVDRWVRSLAGGGVGSFDRDWGRDVVTPDEVEVSPNPTDPVAADVFALAVVAYTCLTGHHPYITRPDATADEQLRELAEGRLIEPKELGVEVRPAVWRVLRSGLARDPGARYTSALVFADELRQGAGVTAPPLERSASGGNTPTDSLVDPDLSDWFETDVDGGDDAASADFSHRRTVVRTLVAALIALVVTNLLTLYLVSSRAGDGVGESPAAPSASTGTGGGPAVASVRVVP